MQLRGLIIFIFCLLILNTMSVSAQKIQSWSSPAYAHQPSFRQFSIIGFNFTEIQDTVLQKWVAGEIREQFNQVENIYTFQPDSSNIYQYEYWMAPVRQLQSDVIFTYSIAPVIDTDNKKKYKKYLPILQRPYSISLWGYFTNQAKNFDFEYNKTETPIRVEVNIYDQKTLQLVFSAKSKAFTSEKPFPVVKKIIEKMILRAIRAQIINEERDH